MMSTQRRESMHFFFDGYISGRSSIKQFVEHHKDFKNILKACFKAYLDWDDDMDIPNDPDTDPDNDTIFIRNLRKVHSRGRPQINRNIYSCQNALRGDITRWDFNYDDAYNKGQSSKGRSGGRRQGGNPHSHLKEYLEKLSDIGKSDSLKTKFFVISLKGPILMSYGENDTSKWIPWDYLETDFLRRFNNKLKRKLIVKTNLNKERTIIDAASKPPKLEVGIPQP
ncbi:hypothetical protein FXO38_01207 [Capsicum annuum]|nr:hypothetical protein FXO38_01207 [Capsicum annuum]